MFKKGYKHTEKKIISLKKIIIPCILFFGIFSYFMFEGMVRKSMMDASTEAYKVEVNHVYVRSNNRGGSYKPTYYYVVDGVEYQYTPKNNDSISINKKKDPTLYYDSSNPSNVVAEYETKLYFGDYVGLAFLLGMFVIIRKKIKFVI